MVSLNVKITLSIYGSHPEALLNTLPEHRSIKIFKDFYKRLTAAFSSVHSDAILML